MAAGAAVAELVAALLGRPQAGTVIAVGGVLVDAAPTPVKEFAVATLGTADKPVLLGGIAVVLAVLAAALGVVAFRNRAAGLAGVAVLGLVGVAAAVTRPAAELVDALPSLVGALVIGGALVLLLRALRPAGSERTRRSVDLTHPTPRSLTSSPDPSGAGLARRPGRSSGRGPRASPWTGGRSSAPPRSSPPAPRPPGESPPCSAGPPPSTRVRESVRLPAPTEPAPPLPAGVEPGFVTADPDFYRVDTALTVPRVDLDSWRLTIGGMVDSPAELSFADLLDRPLVERDVTLNCVSNEVGGPYIGTARWLGVPLATLLARGRRAARRGPAASPLRRRHDDRHPDGRAARRARRRCSPSG